MFTLTLSIYGQNAINGYDSDGKRHGLWEKYYNKTKQLRYSGQFKHGKEIGIFKFYTLNKGKSVLIATKQFNPDNNIAEVKFFSSTGKLISEGKMNGKRYMGDWVFYHNKNDVIMTKEYYNNQGLLDGEKVVYYTNGKVAERSNFKNGKLNGENLIYSEQGVLLKSFQYDNDQLHGPVKYFDAEGKPLAEGEYKRDRKHGFWKYYKNGKLVEEKDHTRRSKNPNKN